MEPLEIFWTLSPHPPVCTRVTITPVGPRFGLTLQRSPVHESPRTSRIPARRCVSGSKSDFQFQVNSKFCVTRSVSEDGNTSISP